MKSLKVDNATAMLSYIHRKIHILSQKNHTHLPRNIMDKGFSTLILKSKMFFPPHCALYYNESNII